MQEQRKLGCLRYDYDTLNIGDWLETAALEITASQIDRFADLTGDRFEIHMSDETARQYGFGGRVAHGLLVLSLVDGLKNRAEARFDAVASLGWDWSFKRPVLIGDTIKATLCVIDKRATRHPDKGIVKLQCDVANQNGDIVQTGSNQLMVFRRSMSNGSE
ncbi:MaoC family dehydratase [Hoeflea sp. TYP-13]|uniref:MaoC family dehydratase n=1 Tax=Hoeflea sp. TYP-13 TaxID=3230023 RepID=UPI0034C6963B